MTKRLNGQGTVYRRRDGRWASALSLEDGRRVFFYSRNRRDAARRLREALEARRLGVFVNQRQTVAEYLAGWLRETAQPRVRPSTYASYESIVRNHIAPAIGRVPMRMLSPQV